ncbi:tryptophan-rich sensory protein [Paenibacillus marinisediminis]
MFEPVSLKWWNLFSLIAVIIINGLAELIPLNGYTTGQISAMFPVLITPAPYTFTIWGLIYVLLLVFIIYQLQPKHHQIALRLGPLFVLSCFFNISWIVLWHYLYSQVWLSLIAMLGLLTSLVFIHMNLRGFKAPSKGQQWLVRLPFTIYLGWVSVATIINVSVVLYELNWSGWGLDSEVWTVIILVSGTFLAWLVGVPYRTPVFMLVYVWAYIGIAVANKSHLPILYSAIGLAALLGLLAITVPFRPKRPYHN